MDKEERIFYFLWQVQLQCPARWLSRQDQSYFLHLLSMLTELQPEYVESQIGVGQLESFISRLLWPK